MDDKIALTTAQDFEVERFSRAIDATADPDALRKLSKQLLMAWMAQRAATTWAMRSGLRPIEIPSMAAEVPPWDDPLA
jgi:hypothetical protein